MQSTDLSRSGLQKIVVCIAALVLNFNLADAGDFETAILLSGADCETVTAIHNDLGF